MFTARLVVFKGGKKITLDTSSTASKQQAIQINLTQRRVAISGLDNGLWDTAELHETGGQRSTVEYLIRGVKEGQVVTSP